jgi:UDP-N-acetylmuramyl tripeptide synthase
MRMGGGTSLPGLVARRIAADIVGYLASQLVHGSAVITGTNGKTTTSGLTAYVLRAGGMRVWRNREGANLMQGITSALTIRAKPTGRLRWHGDAAAVFEVDEAAFPQAVDELRPRVIAITNLFRDQLDRYGEVDTVAERWRTALARLSATTTLVLNADDPAVASLATPDGTNRAIYFGVDEVPVEPESEAESGGSVEVIDTRTCPRCHTALKFSVRFYSHVGHWACTGCDFARPAPSVHARSVVQEGLDAVRFTLVTDEGEQVVRVGLPGLYNVYNALAAAGIGRTMGVGLAEIAQALGRFTPAFGRAERLIVDGRDVRLLLAKNPTGLNEVLRALASASCAPHLLMLLNDHFADGEDVSWIWDADFERVSTMRPTWVGAGGTRAHDLALRLKYAGVHATLVEPAIGRALSQSLDATPAGQTLYIVPTFTAMLAVRAELERQGFAPHYWEQRDA